MAWISDDNKPVQGRCFVIHPVEKQTKSRFSAEYQLEEAKGLALAIELEVVAAEIVMLAEKRPATLLGTGKVESFATLIESQEIELVIVNHRLSPVQQRNLEKAWKCKVIDRTALILEIFGARARTSEGSLQVELAALEYQKSRLVRSWTHLERQRGGFGFMGGPGETQIEADRRMINEQIVRLKKELEEVKRTRELHRKSRRQVPYPIVALVGYTNAGKSTLFNRLTGADVLAEDMLFATLDPTMRVITLPSRRKIILSDTVGFISDLPTELVAAFRATLEEVIEADILLHVRDVADPQMEQHKRDVMMVLKKLGIESEERMIDVGNKVDLLPQEALRIQETDSNMAGMARISALTGKGVDALLERIDRTLATGFKVVDVVIAPSDGKMLSWMYDHAEVLERKDTEEAIHLKVNFDPVNYQRYEREIGKGSA